MVLISKDTVVRYANLVSLLIIMDGAEQAFPAASDLVPMLIIMIGVCSEQAGTAVSDLMAVLIVMVRAIWQDAWPAKDLLHGFRLLSKQRREQETVPAPNI